MTRPSKCQLILYPEPLQASFWNVWLFFWNAWHSIFWVSYNCLTNFLFVLLLGTTCDPAWCRIYSKQKSKYHKYLKKGLRPVSFLEPLWICFNNIIDFVFRDCFVPRYIGSNMDMVKLDSMEDFFSLPLTSWNIRQPAGSSASSNFFSSNFLCHQRSY